jgi:hypothetical protein
MITTTQIIHDKAENVSFKILMVLDKNGTVIETIDMLAQRTTDYTDFTENEISVSSVFSVAENSMMAMSSPEAPSARLDEYGYDHLGNRTTVYLNKGAMAMNSPESPATASEEFHYDHLGNRYQSVDKYGFVSTYTHNPLNQYQQSVLELPYVPDQTTIYSHDDNGNLSEDSKGYSYAYDYRNRLNKVEDYVSSVIARANNPPLRTACSILSITFRWSSDHGR